MTGWQPGHYLVSADPDYLILPSLRDSILGQIVPGEKVFYQFTSPLCERSPYSELAFLHF